MMGVWPQRPQVRTFVVFRLKPLSSRNTSVAPSATFFSQCVMVDADPAGDVVFVPFYGPQRGPLIREPPTFQFSGEVRAIKPDAVGHADDMPNVCCGPPTGLEAMCSGITIEDQTDLVLLHGREFFGSAGGLGSAERFLTVPLEAGPPDPDGDFSDAELVRQVLGRATGVIQHRLSGEASFFQLTTGEAAGPPGRHGHTYMLHSYAEISSTAVPEAPRINSALSSR